jgi:AAA15 family ATPase/GTPase
MLMLLRFGCENFRSFRDYQELSLVASALKDPGPDLFEREQSRERVLPAAVIYGANASGKTNALLALQEMANLVRISHRENAPEGKIFRKTFALDQEYKSKSTRFDCDFLINDSRFHYGFEYNSTCILEEWLYAYDRNYRRLWYYREGQDFSFGKYIRGQNKVISEITRKNSLFLSTAAQNNHDQLTDVYKFFDSIKFNMHSSLYDLPESYAGSATMQQRAIEFLKSADTGICDAKLDFVDPEPGSREFMQDFVSALTKHHPEQSDELSKIFLAEPKRQPDLRLGHVDTSARAVYLPLLDESKGTRRALELSLVVFDIIENGGLLVVDELEASLHTLLSKAFIDLFSSEKSNVGRGQLICTTHDTNLLCSSSLRRDQIWFAEKDTTGQTHLYPLTNIRTRNSDNLERGYLQGRYGAVPFFGNISELFASSGT